MNTSRPMIRHPLHSSILEAFADLRTAPDRQKASFTATLSRILSETFVLSDPDCNMPAFLTDPHIHVLRFAIEDADTDMVPGATRPYGKIHADYHDAVANRTDAPVIVRDAGFALCSTMGTLQELLDLEVIRAGGFAGFHDPIYEDSLILVHVDRSAQAEWHLRLSGKTPIAA